MNKIAHYLQDHIKGEVMDSVDARRYFSTDGSIFTVPPAVIVYPRNENDVRKTARFSWQLAERGRITPITARGSGTDQSGAAIGAGVMMVFPAHMNRVLEFDGKSGDVIVEPGINYAKLQQTLHTHSKFLPPYPASVEYSTVGGAVANNSAGEKSVKYGSIVKYVKNLRVVLANGEVIETRRLSKRELNKKLGLSTMEGDLYRNLDALIEENKEIIKGMKRDVSKNVAGYALADVKQKNGSFDLTPLIVGSQGTLGIITEITLSTETYNPQTTLIAAMFDDIKTAGDVVLELHKLPEKPCAVEMVDKPLLDYVKSRNPNLLKGVLPSATSKLVILIEFDNPSDRAQKRMVKKTTKLLKKHQVEYRVESDPQKKEDLWKIRHSAAAVISHAEGGERALPIIEDGIVPLAQFERYLDAIHNLLERNGLQAAVWGHAGDGHLHMQPFLDISQVGDRQKIFRLMEEYYKLVIDMGGSISGEHGDGRLRGPYLERMYGAEAYELFCKVKQAFDPFSILNPGVKIGVALDDIKPLIRQEFTLAHLHQFMPR